MILPGTLAYASVADRRCGYVCMLRESLHERYADMSRCLFRRYRCLGVISAVRYAAYATTLSLPRCFLRHRWRHSAATPKVVTYAATLPQYYSAYAEGHAIAIVFTSLSL